MKEKQPIWTRSFISISLIQFIVFTVFYSLLTTLPIYVIDDLAGTEAEGGLVVTVMLIAAILIRPFSGKILEIMGKKNGLVISAILFAVTTVFYMFTNTYFLLLAIRFLHGLSFAVLTTATGALAADLVPDDRRGEGLGYFAMSMNVAIVVGPFIGLTLLQYYPFFDLFLLLSVIMVIGAGCSFLIEVPADSEAVHHPAKKISFHDLLERKAMPIAFISSLVAFSYSSVVSFLSVFTNEVGLSTVSSYFFVVFAIMMILSRPYLGRRFDLSGPAYVILPCLLLFAIGLITLSITQSAWMLLVSGGLIGLGYGALVPSFQTMAIQSSNKARSGHATATFFTLYDSGIAVGSFIFGIIVSSLGFTYLYLFSALIVVLVMGLFVLYQTRVQRSKGSLKHSS
ncbi:MFS transporter [Aquibacillus sp. 3ASR75-11]|uniref:MFS transporter n=1 Tax=Terrihalobacillus insolitus TaxID=2950438 RepID=A0A9X4APM1_9BACI|nr:MFS transporter [Terrihalobacillus insolitus]MDC3413266.1 MFS transporter [Terrihalobacillus insolitus]MDC3425680.1 MFS transporter [Terrihalobacillus insolitus]